MRWWILSREYLAGGTERKTSTADHYQVLVHVDEAALRGQPNTDSKSDLPIETVRRLCCDGSVVAVTESKESSAAKVVYPMKRRTGQTRQRTRLKFLRPLRQTMRQPV